MLIAFFDEFGMVYRHWVPQGHGVDRFLYRQVMEQLREAVRRRHPQQWRAQNWCLLHDNAPAHTANLVVDFLRDNHVELLPHPGYSPDLSPCDYWLFAQLKKIHQDGVAVIFGLSR